MNIQRKNSSHHFRMQSECEQTLVIGLISLCMWCLLPSPKSIGFGKDIKTMALNSNINLR